MGDSAPRRDLYDPICLAMRDERMWCQDKDMYAKFRIKHMACLCKLCKRSRKHMAMDTVEKHLMDNGRHHSFRRWRGPCVRDDSDDEWDDHVCRGGAPFPPRPVEMNVGLQRLFENVNATPPAIVPPTSEAHGAGRAEQQDLPDITTNWEDAKLDDHIMEVVQEAQTIVENVQAGADSMQERERMRADAGASAPGDSPGRPEMDDAAAGP